ncbi:MULTISPECIES: acyltransferase family protein [Reichenbachiella]|uniref:acyltransferase family protein n=1 Tax=Reichenbachiella TaxID=156993 RepID=UPI0011C43BDD|nr:acyltransferase [Reichenbachiella sp. MSK19-1]MBU2915468.1 acyltransferase [Reichenbachiella agariperforans]
MTILDLKIFDRLRRIVQSEDRIEAFDFVRSMAALSVIVTHFEILETYSIDIDAFFILSGYLVVQMLSREEPMVNQRYFVSRWTKIIPSYFFFLVAAFLIGKLFFAEIYGENLPKLSEWKQYFLFYRNYAGLPHRWAFEHVWTLCVEEHFYVLIWIVSLAAVSRVSFRRYAVWFSCFVIVCCVIAKVQAMYTDIAEYPTYTHNRLDAFCYGALIFLFRDQIRNLKFFQSGFFCLIAGGMLLLITQIDQTTYQLGLRITSPLLLAYVLVYLTQFRFHRVFRILAYYSYNAYLWHFFILIPIVHYWGYSVVGFVIYFGGTVVLAFLSTHFVEDIFIQRRTQLFEFLFKNKRV